MKRLFLQRILNYSWRYNLNLKINEKHIFYKKLLLNFLYKNVNLLEKWHICHKY